MAGLVPAIHVFLAAQCFKTWMPGTSAGHAQLPGMTSSIVFLKEPPHVS